MYMYKHSFTQVHPYRPIYKCTYNYVHMPIHACMRIHTSIGL